MPGVPSGDPAPYVTHVSLNRHHSTYSAPLQCTLRLYNILLSHSTTLLLCVKDTLLQHCNALLLQILYCVAAMYCRRCGFHLISFQRIKLQSRCYKQAFLLLLPLNCIILPQNVFRYTQSRVDQERVHLNC